MVWFIMPSLSIFVLIWAFIELELYRAKQVLKWSLEEKNLGVMQCYHYITVGYSVWYHGLKLTNWIKFNWDIYSMYWLESPCWSELENFVISSHSSRAKKEKRSFLGTVGPSFTFSLNPSEMRESLALPLAY